MADLKSKVEDALNETRILILGGQVLIGSAYRMFFLLRFDNLARGVQWEITWVLGAMLLGIGLLQFPAAFHQIAEFGEDTADLHLKTTRVMDWTLFIFAAGLGSFISVAVQEIMSSTWAASLGAASFLVAMALWYLLPLSAKRHDSQETHRKLKQEENQRQEEAGTLTPLDEKIKTVLIETRMVLPGAQALLGFQLIAMLEQGFASLPFADKVLHVCSLGAIGASTVLLMAPAAFHRIAEGGENTERMHRYSSRMLLGAMFLLALGVCGDYAMVLHKMTNSYWISTIVSGAMLCFFYALWFGYSYTKRGARTKLLPQTNRA